jgi:ABC-type dipeptide/oligopeptide/nickel transport system permease subunit
MLYFAQARHAFLTGTWVWWVLPPGLMLAGLVAALLLVSYYFEEAADPRLGRTAKLKVENGKWRMGNGGS